MMEMRSSRCLGVGVATGCFVVLVAERLVDRARTNGVSLTGDRGYANSRNGYDPKAVATDVGDVRVDVPRDRNGSLEPQTVPVGTRRLSGVDSQIISLYAKGLTTGDIAAHLFDVYDYNTDQPTISRITDGIVEDMNS